MATPTPKKARKVPPCATPTDPAKDIKLPMVKSYALDIPTDPAELAQFDRSVSSIFYRITGRVATKDACASGDSASGTEVASLEENDDPPAVAVSGNASGTEVAAREESDDQQEGESKGYLSENSPGRSEVNDDDRDQQAFWAWQDNCECPKGTKRSQCSCERVPAYFAWVDNCTCDTNEMGRCTCGACAPQFSFAKGKVA